MVDRQGSKIKMTNTANKTHYHDYRHKRINGTVPLIQIMQFRYYTSWLSFPTFRYGDFILLQKKLNIRTRKV